MKTIERRRRDTHLPSLFTDLVSSVTLFTDMVFIVDIIIAFLEYLIRATVIGIRSSRSHTWPVVKAIVTSTACPKNGSGCYVAEICYEYRVDGEPFLGTKKEPFIFHSSGEEYISHFVTGKEFTVCVKPGDPTISVVA
jgi:hypothetical protein